VLGERIKTTLGNLVIEMEMDEIKIFGSEAEDGAKGYVWVVMRTLRENQIVSMITVKLFFKRSDIPIDRLTSAAFRQARRMICASAEMNKSDLPGEDPQSLWIE